MIHKIFQKSTQKLQLSKLEVKGERNYGCGILRPQTFPIPTLLLGLDQIESTHISLDTQYTSDTSDQKYCTNEKPQTAFSLSLCDALFLTEGVTRDEK